MMKEMRMDEILEVNGGNGLVKAAEVVFKVVRDTAIGKAAEEVFKEALKPTPPYESKQPGFNRP